MVVVLPAPFGPSSPKISPARISKLTPSTATCHSGGDRSNEVSLDQSDRRPPGLRYRLLKSHTRTTASVMVPLRCHDEGYEVYLTPRPPLRRGEGELAGRARTQNQVRGPSKLK